MKKILLIAFTAISLMAYQGNAQVNATDSLSLVAFYNSTGGATWVNNDKWLIAPVGSWFGVTIAAGSVTAINLPDNNLRGRIPAELGNLSNITVLNLANNQINGPIPVEIGNLATLDQLILAGNGTRLTGDIPIEMGNLINLTQLDLSRNSLTGAVPPELNNLTRLDNLDLSANSFTSLPDLSALTALSVANFSGNSLTTLPNISTWPVPNLDIQLNNLEFDDLEPYVNKVGLVFSPQKSLAVGSIDINVAVGGQVNITLPVGGTSNQYQWVKNDIDIAGQTTDNLVQSNIRADDDGSVFYLRVASSLVPGLTLVSEPLNLDVSIAYFWIGNGGKWDDLSHWSTASGGVADQVSLPGTKDDVTFDAKSFTIADQVVEVPDKGTDVGVEFNNMDWSAVSNGPTFRIKAVTSQWLASSTEGSLIFSDDMVIDFHHAEFYFSGAGDYVLDTKGHYMGENCFLALGYGWSSLQTLNTTTCNVLSKLNNVLLYLNKGNFKSNGYDILGQKDQYTWLRGDNVVFDISGSYIETGYFIKTAPTSVFIDDNAVEKIYLNANGENFNFNHVIVADTVDFLNYNYQFDTLEIVPGGVLKLHPGTTNTVGELIAYGTENKPITIQSRTEGSPATISKTGGVVEAYDVIIKDNIASGGAKYNAYSSLNAGNTTGWNFFNTAPVDSLAMVDLYNTTDGANWNNSNNWLVGPVEVWSGLTVTSGRVTAVGLAGNNLRGYLKETLDGMSWLKTIDVSNNSIDSLAVNFLLMDSLTSVNLSGNTLDFADLQNNIGAPGIVYDTQLPQDAMLDSLIYAGNPVLLEYIIDGTGNTYRWYKDGLLLPDSTRNAIAIDSISRATMGNYYVEVTNPNVPGLTLNSSLKNVLAVADISGYLFIDADSTPAESGKVTLLHVQAENGFDTTAIAQVGADGSYLFEKAVLWDYVITGFADTLSYQNALPTYYKKTVLWEEADTVILVEHEKNLDIINQFNTQKLNGESTITGTFEEELEGNPGGRVMSRGRIKRAGVAIRRRVRAGRTAEDAFELVTYVYTDANGEFIVNNLEDGEYRLNFQYPGYPMDTTTDVDILVSSGYKTNFARVEALVTEGKIKVRRLIILGADDIPDVEVKAYPNPTDGKLRVSWPADKVEGTMDATITNSEGRVLHQDELTPDSNIIDVAHLDPGLYILVLKSRDGRFARTVRFIVKYE